MKTQLLVTSFSVERGKNLAERGKNEHINDAGMEQGSSQLEVIALLTFTKLCLKRFSQQLFAD